MRNLQDTGQSVSKVTQKWQTGVTKCNRSGSIGFGQTLDRFQVI
jgi:hypothetical protein